MDGRSFARRQGVEPLYTTRDVVAALQADEKLSFDEAFAIQCDVFGDHQRPQKPRERVADFETA